MIVQIIGTRPQHIKLIKIPNSIVIDTGQHYSDSLTTSRNNIDVQLEWQDSLRENVKRLRSYIPFDCELIVVYGDTYSTLVGALVAKRTNTRLVHIEAGVRTGVRTVEERIRTLVDKMSDIRFCPNEKAWMNLLKPNMLDDYIVGDLMYDKFLEFSAKRKGNKILTIHRRENLEDLQKILWGIRGWTNFYCHPHTEKYMAENNIIVPKHIFVFGTLEKETMLVMLKNCPEVITDSGGLMKEAYWSGCRVKVVGSNPWPEIYAFGEGTAGEQINTILKEEIGGI